MSTAEANLVSINSAALGASMPEVSLPDGSKVQTGTFGALLINIRAYNDALAANDKGRMEQLESAIVAALPLLHKVGLFDLFPPEEWIQGDNEGRRVVGHLYRDFKAQLGGP